MINKHDNLAEFLFHQGTNFRTYNYMGAHRQGKNFVFRTWAPAADNVYLCGDFNNWGNSHPMKRITEGGIWSVVLDDKTFGDKSRYKFLIEFNGKQQFKSDPYAFFSETKINTASLFYTLDGFKWTDGEFMKKRYANAYMLSADEMLPSPMNTYEVHLGSWKRHSDGSYYTYTELANELSDYALDMGYTHIEIMPVSEHPYDGSWGYQICGYYAPTSRFGTPHDFMNFVNTFHKKGIGVILDWVPSHFPKDAHGLYEFDGGPLYEYQGEDRMEHKSWGTRAFDVGRNEVQSFLISNALYWLDKYHIDGLRVDAVASMLYLDYDREPGTWNPNEDGTNINKQAVAFFQKLNSTVKSNYPDILMIAEESTSYAAVTYKDGLGFNLKWNMGWMNDTLSYVETDPLFRKGCHNKMTFSIVYAFGENYVLPISHDEVVHGKKSLIDKMFGSYEQKFDGMRTYLAYMMAHPGKKLMFMGCEFAQFCEWDSEKQLEWFMLQYPKHNEMKNYVKALNHFYISRSELWEKDGAWDGFRWIDADRDSDNTYIFERINHSGDKLICAFNFSPILRENYPVPVDESGTYEQIFSTENPSFGGKGYVDNFIKTVTTLDETNLLKITLPPLGAGFYIIKKELKNNKEVAK